MSPAAAISAVLQVLRLLASNVRVILGPFLSTAVLPLLLIPSKSKSQRNEAADGDRGINSALSHQGRAAKLEEQEAMSSAGTSQEADAKSHRRRLEGDRCCTSRHSSSEPLRTESPEDGLREGDMGPGCVSEADLEELVSRLELREVDTAHGPWEMIVDKGSASVEYCAWRRDPEDGGPTEYKTWTRFRGCTADRLCAFYLDCDYSLTYEVMIRSYDDLGFNQDSGQETGRLVKKYPLCSAREYILGWRVWTLPSDGPSSTYFCVTKAVEHPLAPRTSSIRRTDAYRCSWRIREVYVEGAGWCAEIDMYLREDSGMQRSMAKLAFRRSIWGYIQGTDTQLRGYPFAGEVLNGRSLPLSVKHAKKVPSWIRRTYMGDTASELTASRDMSFSLSVPSEVSELANKSPVGSEVTSVAGCPSNVRTPGDALQRPTIRVLRRQQSDSGGWGILRRRAFPVLAAAAGIGTMTIARGPVGLAAKVLVACAVRVLAAEHNVEARREPLRLARQRSRSKSMRQAVKYSR